MIRTIGACLILGVSGGFGLAKSIGFRRQSRQLRQLITLLELLRCELNYTLLPLPRLCVLTAERCKAPICGPSTMYLPSSSIGTRTGVFRVGASDLWNTTADMKRIKLELDYRYEAGEDFAVQVNGETVTGEKAVSGI